MFRGYIPNIDDMSYNALILLLHQGFSIEEFAHQINAKLVFATDPEDTNIDFERIKEEFKDD
jgi:hypothetical protein